MAILSEAKFTDGGHWYRPDGTPCHQVPKKDGTGMKGTTLKEARQLKLLPSVTGITNILHKEALMNWKARQIAMAAFDKPPQGEETLEYFMERVIASSESVKIQAANLGNKVHDALEQLLVEGPQAVPENLWAYVEPVMKWKADNKVLYKDVEKVVVNLEHGYAGKCDVFAALPDETLAVVDYKTRKGEFSASMKPYDGQGMQLAAYAVAKWGEERLPHVAGINVYISSVTPGLIHAYKHDSLVAHWEAFKAACILWRYIKGYDPRQPAFSTLKEAA